MGAWRILVGLAGTIGLIVLVAGAYYLFSLLVLTLAGRFFPLAGRGRRRD